MYLRLFIVGLFLTSFSLSHADEPVSSGNVEHTVAEIFYDVSAPSLSKLGRYMKKSAPKDENGKSNISFVSSKWDADVKTLKTNDSCTLNKLTIHLTSTLTSPRWAEYQDASRAEQRGWDAFEDGLSKHSQGHLDINLEIATAVKEALSKVGSFPDCAALRHHMSVVASDAEAKFKDAHSDYDRDTKNGRTQGAILLKQLD